MKKNIYKIDNSVEKIINGSHTLFLDKNEFYLVKSKLNKKDYNVYSPFDDSEKVIIYSKKYPNVKVVKVICDEQLKHQQVLGSLLALDIEQSYIGDIILYNGEYYIFLISDICDYVINNLVKIGIYNIILEEIPIIELKDYKRSYEQVEIILSSLRIDNAVSVLANVSRKNAIDKIKNNEVVVNCNVITKNSYTLKENDIFSIRKLGKYKYVGIIKNTKNNNYIVKLLKYI